MVKARKIHWWGLARRLVCLMQPRTLVLTYHHVCPPGRTAPWVTVSPGELDEQMEYLVRQGLAAPMSSLLEDLQSGQFSARARVIITFDDAAVDFVEWAVPILKRHQVPATLFVPTGLIGRQGFWWNRLYRLSEAATSQKVDLGCWLGTVSTEQTAADSWRRLRFMPDEEREELLDRCGQQLDGVGTDGGPRPMTWAEIGDLDRSGLITLGAHTHTHPVLTALDDTELQAEVCQSRDELRGLSSFLPVFAYPYGDPAAVDARVRAAARRAGFKAGFTTAPRRILPQASALALGRLCIDGMTLDQFRWMIDYHLCR